MARYRTTIRSTDREAMLDLVRRHKVQVFDHTDRYSDAEGWSVDAALEPADIRRLERAGYRIERHEDIAKLGRARQAEVGRGDRYRKPGAD